MSFCRAVPLFCTELSILRADNYVSSLFTNNLVNFRKQLRPSNGAKAHNNGGAVWRKQGRRVKRGERVLPPAWSKGSGISKAVDVQWRHEDTNWLEQKTAPLRKKMLVDNNASLLSVSPSGVL